MGCFDFHQRDKRSSVDRSNYENSNDFRNCLHVILTIKTALMRNQTTFMHMEVHYNSAQAKLRLGLRCGSACGPARAAIGGFGTALLAFKSHSQSGQQRQQH